MPPIIPISRHFDQSTLSKMIDTDAVVQRYRARFALFDWSAIDPPRKRGPGAPAHPKSAYLKAALVRISEYLLTTPRWRAYLLDHPLLVLELGFPPSHRLHAALWLQRGHNGPQRPSFEQLAAFIRSTSAGEPVRTKRPGLAAGNSWPGRSRRL